MIKSPAKLGINKSWTLFLDRDGVINKKIEDDYVRNWSRFKFIPYSVNAVKMLSKLFGKIIVVTNCRGIGRKLMTKTDLAGIHKKMLEKISASGGRIDKIYFCPHDIPDNCSCRKPKPGLAFKAKKDFPEISFSKAVMAGDSLSDMEFGKSLGMFTVFLTNSNISKIKSKFIDFACKDLHEFYKISKS